MDYLYSWYLFFFSLNNQRGHLFCSLDKLYFNIITMHICHLNTDHIFTDESKSEKEVECLQWFFYHIHWECTALCFVYFYWELQAILLTLCYSSTGISFYYYFLILKDCFASCASIVAIFWLVIFRSFFTRFILGRRLSFCWIPSYFGIVGNEKADSYAHECVGASRRLNPYARVTYAYSDFLPILETLLWWFNSLIRVLYGK